MVVKKRLNTKQRQWVISRVLSRKKEGKTEHELLIHGRPKEIRRILYGGDWSFTDQTFKPTPPTPPGFVLRSPILQPLSENVESASGQEDIYLSNFEDFCLPSSQETLSSSSRTDIEEEPYLDKEENLDYISFCNGSTLDTPNISFVQQSNPITSSFAQRLSYLEGGSPPLLEPSDGEDDEDDAELETREEEITKVEGVGVKKD